MKTAPPLNDGSWSGPFSRKGYEYRISSKGYVYKMPWTESFGRGGMRCKSGLILRPNIDKNGTLRVHGDALHNIIFSFYYGEFNVYANRIRHKDGNEYNNSIDNLIKESSQKILMDNSDEDISEKDYLAKYYRVTREGRVFRISDNRELASVAGPKGYMYIRLKSPKFSKNKDRRKNYKVHRLVAMFYLRDYSETLQVNHINGNKKDNRVENLEMVTNQENVIHAYKYLNSAYRRKVLSERSCRAVVEIKSGVRFKSIREACTKLNISRTAVFRSLRRDVPCRCGLHFRYANNE